MAYIGMAHIVVAYVGMTYMVIAYIVMVYMVMAYMVIAYLRGIDAPVRRVLVDHARRRALCRLDHHDHTRYRCAPHDLTIGTYRRL